MQYTVKRTEKTEVVVGQNLLQKLDSILKNNKHSGYMVICDKTTETFFAKEVITSLKKLNVPLHIFVLEEGEKSKSFSCVSAILNEMFLKKIDRRGAVIALGGGVVGDVATLISALYNRGIDCIQIPTTLLSQVDSSLGGKGAVNLEKHKNTVGVIVQPKIVIVDTNIINSLPQEQITSAMGEIIKYAIAMDAKLFEELEKLNAVNADSLKPIIKKCIELKMQRVVADPLDLTGIRAELNFGHTLGHAVELLSNIPHGQAIFIGMVFAIKLSLKEKILDEKDAARSLNLINKYNLLNTPNNISLNEIYKIMKQDKKAFDEHPRFVLLKNIGKTVIQTVPEGIINETIKEVLE